MSTKSAVNGPCHNPKLAGWFMPEPLDPRVMLRVITLRAWRERNAFIGPLRGGTRAQEPSRRKPRRPLRIDRSAPCLSPREGGFRTLMTFGGSLSSCGLCPWDGIADSMS